MMNQHSVVDLWCDEEEELFPLPNSICLCPFQCLDEELKQPYDDIL